MKSLPRFRVTSPEYATSYAKRVFDDKLFSVVVQPNHAFRAVFAPDYFTMAEAQTEPSKSQWNTLKKRMKRFHGGVFVFKEHGNLTLESIEWVYVDFGFLEDLPTE